MGNGVALAEKLQQEILKLPPEALPELEKYIEFLRFKVRSSEKTQKRSRSGRQSTIHSDRSASAYAIGSSEVGVTEADVEALRAQSTRAHAPSAVRELARAYKLAEQETELSEEERDRRFWENVEATRMEAITAGMAIDEPSDLLADD
jgi:hypothetical protein